jgi:hypothetical protein
MTPDRAREKPDGQGHPLGDGPHREESPMIGRIGMLGVAAALVGLAGGAVAPALGSSGRDDDGGDREVISVVSTNTEESFVDVGDKGFSLGDEFVFASRLRWRGENVGHTGVVCTITSVQREESQCLGTAWFHHGQIAIQGLVAGEPERFSFSVTGGTGAYEGAEGTLYVRELSGGRERLTFSLDD